MIRISLEDEDKKINPDLKNEIISEAEAILKKYDVKGELTIHIKTIHNKNLTIIKSHLVSNNVNITTNNENYGLKKTIDDFFLSLEHQLMKKQDIK